MPLLWHNFVPPNSIGLRQGKNFCAPWESLQSLGEEVRLTALKDSGLTPGLDPACLFSRVPGTSRNSLCISAPDPSSHYPTWLLLGELLVVHLMSSISKSLLLAQSLCAAWSTIYSPKRHHPVFPKTNDETPCLCSYLKSTKNLTLSPAEHNTVAYGTQTRLRPCPHAGPPALLRALTGEPACLGSIPAWPCVT